MSPGRYSGHVGENHSLPASSRSKAETLDATVGDLAYLDADQLRLQWRNHLGGFAPAHLPRWLLLRVLAYRLQAAALGDLDRATMRFIRIPQGGAIDSFRSPFKKRMPRTRDGIDLNSGTLLVREWNDNLEKVMVLDAGFAWNGKTFSSLSRVAKAITGTSWNGHRFFGLRSVEDTSWGKGVARIGDKKGKTALGQFKDPIRVESKGSGREEAQSIGSDETERPVADAKRSSVHLTRLDVGNRETKPGVPVEGDPG